jgi:hypothetical protein
MLRQIKYFHELQVSVKTSMHSFGQYHLFVVRYHPKSHTQGSRALRTVSGHRLNSRTSLHAQVQGRFSSRSNFKSCLPSFSECLPVDAVGLSSWRLAGSSQPTLIADSAL